MITYWNGLCADQQIQLIQGIITALTIIIGARISIYQFTKTKKKEIEFKMNEQRKAKYEELLKLLQKVFVNSEQIAKGKYPFTREHWFEVQMGMMIYASQDVFQKLIIPVWRSYHSGWVGTTLPEKGSHASGYRSEISYCYFLVRILHA